MSQLNDLLEYVETISNDGEFVVVNEKWHTGSMLGYRSDGARKWFTTRLFPRGVTSRSLTTCTKTVRFVRVDMELADHKEVPSHEERQEAITYLKDNCAAGAVNTPHGVHGYFITDTSIDENLIPSCVDRVMTGWNGTLRLDRSISVARQGLSRWIDELEFYSPEARVNTTGLTLAAELIKTPRVRRSHNCVGGSEGDKHELCSRVQSLRAKGVSRSEVMAECGVDDKYMARLEGDPAYDVHKRSYYLGNDGDNEDCLLPLGPISKKRLYLQRTKKVFADRWWCYQALHALGMDLDGVINAVKNDATMERHRTLLLKNFQLSHDTIGEWVEADVKEWWETYADYCPQEVHPDVLDELEGVLKGKIKVKINEIKSQLSQAQLRRALLALGYTCTLAGRNSYYERQKNEQQTNKTECSVHIGTNDRVSGLELPSVPMGGREAGRVDRVQGAKPSEELRRSYRANKKGLYGSGYQAGDGVYTRLSAARVAKQQRGEIGVRDSKRIGVGHNDTKSDVVKVRNQETPNRLSRSEGVRKE